MKAGKINLIDVRHCVPAIAIIILSISGLLLVSCERSITIKEIKEIRDYPSGSGIEYFKDHFYLIGDDAGYLAVLNKSFEITDTINLVPSQQKQISKEIKPYIEAIVVMKKNHSASLLLIASGSLVPFRNSLWIINADTRQKEKFQLDTFYNRLKARGIREVNIEGAAATRDIIILANRGNKSFPKNHLIFTSSEFWKDQGHCFVKIISVGGNGDTTRFSGVSGLAYSSKSDRLILTVSTEETYGSNTDGAIGKSYLWVIDDISSKRRYIAMNANKIIDLNSLDKRFEGHKIESACIVSETNKRMDLVLAADDDKGATILFKVTLIK